MHQEQDDSEVLTVGKYPSVKTLSKLVLPQAPSPMMTSFLRMTFCWFALDMISTSFQYVRNDTEKDEVTK
jgi:hypothetical protein